MTNTILDRLNINIIFCRPDLYVMMKLGDAWIDMNDIFINNYNHSSILTDCWTSSLPAL